ncbi:MAG: hypothetical protein ACRDD0_09990 [Bacteroidales bacterium]
MKGVDSPFESTPNQHQSAPISTQSTPKPSPHTTMYQKLTHSSVDSADSVD